MAGRASRQLIVLGGEQLDSWRLFRVRSHFLRTTVRYLRPPGIAKCQTSLKTPVVFGLSAVVGDSRSLTDYRSPPPLAWTIQNTAYSPEFSNPQLSWTHRSFTNVRFPGPRVAQGSTR